MKKTIIVIFSAALLAAAFVTVRYPSIMRDLILGGSEPISVFTAGNPADILLPDNASFRQDHPDWASDKMGQTTDTLGDYGCTVSSVANAISNVTGTEISPKILNENLGKVSGYTNRGWLIWSKVSQATQGAVQITVHDQPSQTAIEACMVGGGYPIVKIKLGGVVPHWIMLVGRKNGEYIMRDPLLGKPSDGPLPISVRSKKIHSLRCLSKI